MTDGLRTISLYSGAGGLDRGFVDAQFDVVWANELDPWACKTYAENIGRHVVCGDVLQTKPPDDLETDVVIGGPPCQGFSVIGKMNEDDPRSRHVFHFLDVVESTEASAFVLENVKVLGANPRWEPIRDQLVGRAEGMGFQVKTYLLNAADFKVPQSRERMFMIGIRGGPPRKPTPVTKGHPPTVRSALAKLPPFGQPGNDNIVRARVVPAAVPVMRPNAFRGSLLFNGSGRPLHLDAPAKTLPASMGGNATPIIDQEELEEGVEPWVVSYHRRLLEGGTPLKRAPKRLRRLTVEEAAALQTMDDWTFKGPQVAQLRQIGNAVPPMLAYHVALSVRRAIRAARRPDVNTSELALTA